ncbi:MAG TPA: hypothetical protein VEA16_16310, partial [Vicinamibacterales bacterium]|nr:hypothetical protein [Vicinamibacterales bacterium]
MADPRTPYYELHIRPLIRLLDRTQMRFKFDLWSYDDVKANADDIVRVISDGTMPPPSHGGPWPREWIDLFARWQATGFQKLEVATASAGITAARVGPLIRVTAKGKHP